MLFVYLFIRLYYITFIIGVNKVKADTVDSIGKLSYGLPRRSWNLQRSSFL